MSQHVAVFVPGWIGDVVMATPSLRAIRQFYGPEATLTAVMKPYVADVLSGLDWFDQTIFYDWRARRKDYRMWPVANRLRELRPDVALLLSNSMRTALIAWRSGARVRIGYARNGRGPLLTTRLRPPHEGFRRKPFAAIDYCLQIAYAAGCPPQPRRMELATLPADEEITDRIWDKQGFTDGRPVVLFNTGGAYGDAKHWPLEYFASLGKRIVGQLEASVMVICGPHERESAAWIADQIGNPRAKSMADEDLSLGVAKACVRRSQLMVTTDSGPRQFAPAFDVPVISLFGPIDPQWSKTYHPRETTLMHKVPCGPCGKRTCPLGHHECMKGLSVERVFSEVARKLSDQRRFAA